MDKNKLNIGVFATISLPIPPFNGYGGTQRGVYDFLEHMNDYGHKISLFGPRDSDVSHLDNVQLYGKEKSLWVPENKFSLEEKRIKSQKHYEYSFKKLKEMKNEFDVINLRMDNVSVLERMTEIFGKDRIIYSLHNVRNNERIQSIEDTGVHCIAHCRNHKSQYGGLKNIKVITYGINVDSYPFSNETLSKSSLEPKLDVLKYLKDKKEDYLITLGGIGRHKGQKSCIQFAKETGNNLIIAGTPQFRENPANMIYFKEHVEPEFNNKDIIYFGNADEEQKKELLKFSKGFLFPSGYEDTTWNEPFGRAPVEALTCGTPVVSYLKGSSSEIIFDKYNGFLFTDRDEAIKGVKSLDEIDRMVCRDICEKKFDSKRVAKEYEEFFYEILNK